MKHKRRKPDITETHPDVAAEWDHERNETGPTDVTYGSGIVVWWRCSVQGCGHRWLARVGDRTRGKGCPECRRHRKPASGQSLADRRPELIVEWDHERNEMEPTDVTCGSRIRAWWRCSVRGCGHRWQARVSNRTRGSGCPKCRWRPASGQSLADKHPELIVEWVGEWNPTAPHDVTPGSAKKVWWRCSVRHCGHTWQARVASRTAGSGCPNCAYRRRRRTGQDTDRKPDSKTTTARGAAEGR